MTKTFLTSFAIIGGALIWLGSALDMIASAIVAPASEHQCGEYPLWCFYNHHPSFGLLGAVMCVMALAAFVTFIFDA